VKHRRPTMLLAMLLVAHTVSAANLFGASGTVIYINIPLGGDAATKDPPSLGFDVDMPVDDHRRASFRGAVRRHKPVVPLEIELTRRGPYRVKIAGFYLDFLK